MTPAELAQVAVAGGTLLGMAWGFYSGILPRWIRRVNGTAEIRDRVERIETDVHELHTDHDETMDEIRTLKAGQVAIAETVADEHNSIDARRLREQHFGSDGDRPDDFLHGRSPTDDD